VWQNLAAGVFAVPTTSVSHLTIGNRVALLRFAVNVLKQYRDQPIAAAPSPRWGNVQGRPSLVFVAPEYMFVREGFQLSVAHDLKRNCFPEKPDRKLAIGEMQRIGSEYGKQLVFVPGSIASREALPAPGVGDRDERVNRAITCMRMSALSIRSAHPSFAGLTDEETAACRCGGILCTQSVAHLVTFS
jgi:hypothetical protein